MMLACGVDGGVVGGLAVMIKRGIMRLRSERSNVIDSVDFRELQML